MNDKGKKGLILNYIPRKFTVEKKVNPDRIFEANNSEIKDGNIIYLTQKALRVEDNFALNFALEKAEEFKKNIQIIHIKENFDVPSKAVWFEKQIENLKNNYDLNEYKFKTFDEKNSAIDYINKSAAILVKDFNPIEEKEIFDKISCRIYEVDSQNIMPARVISDKQEYSAHSFRRKVYANIGGYLTEFPERKGKNEEAWNVLNDFIANKLENYAEERNEPEHQVTSGFSRYFNWGFISPHRAAIEVIKSSASNLNKTDFLEEMIVRRELSDNFCLYNKNFKTFEGAPSWAKATLNQHLHDFRQNLYSKEELENAGTYDELWNYTQNQLKNEGRIHSYLRMYWAKKLLEWTKTPQDAIDAAIYLNDKYGFDAPSANGYVGIMWSICGLHDRPFQDRPVTGKIRRMNADKFRRKCL